MRFSVWHGDTGNWVGDFESEAAAIRGAREAAELGGVRVEDLVIQRNTESGPEYVVGGQPLARRVLHPAIARKPAIAGRAASQGYRKAAAKPLRRRRVGR